VGSDIGAFGPLLRQYRLAAGLSQQMLAERADLSVDAIAALERGRRATPRMETTARLAAALDLKPAERTMLVAAAVGESHSDTSRQASSPPRQSGAAAQPYFLPLPATILMGREREEATVQQLLRRAAGSEGPRVITLTGPGGVGKTRLAIAAASALRATFSDGIVFVDLSAIRDPELVPLTIAQSLGLRENGDQSVQDLLAAFLNDRRLLLVIDNAEQVVEAAPHIGTRRVTGLSRPLTCPSMNSWNCVNHGHHPDNTLTMHLVTPLIAAPGRDDTLDASSHIRRQPAQRQSRTRPRLRCAPRRLAATAVEPSPSSPRPRCWPR
jgi:transcriptional regulator with XRE-family HTH domain